MPEKITSQGQLLPGEIYEDCRFHPCVCITVDDNILTGISLIDGSYPHNCKIGRCKIRKLSLQEAMEWKKGGPQQLEEFGLSQKNFVGGWWK